MGRADIRRHRAAPGHTRPVPPAQESVGRAVERLASADGLRRPGSGRRPV